MADTNYHIGDYSVKSTGSMDLSCDGKVASFQATGEEGKVVVTAGDSVGLFSGNAMAVVQNNEPEAGKITLGVAEAGTVELTSGPPVEGARITMESGELLEIAIGPPGAGASITLTPESIILKVAETTLTLSAEGIIEDVGEVTREVSMEGHNFTAAETEMNVSPTGFTMEGPMVSNEFEGSVTVNETMGTYTSDAARTATAAITTIT